ncbi:hypothetical protein EW026_g1116 [Hermanssonia centrifuga]|uniref:Uncharacterized protein n=1 Tax=Hermanssonia centrifuga TaxID=98765 RepID=A0A4S4KT57_9APHY|nr:hypothetical protein EW026_g1116 [Hermanssonia centrifuga]
MELSLLRIPLMDQESKILHFGVLSRLRHLRWTKRLHRSDLAAATSYLRSCTESQVIDSFHQGVFYEEMGVCLSSRYCLQKDQLVLESAIECLQKSIASVRRASPTKPLIFFIWQLAYLQFYRFEGTQDVEFLDESVRQLRQCIMLSVIDNAALAACFRLLIRELVLKFELYQNRADLDEAISIHDYLGALPKRALSPHDKDLAARGNRKIVNTDRWRTAHSSLLYLRFMDTGQYRDLQSAVENLEDVLQGLDDESAAVREEATASLVNCLMQRFRVHGRVEDLRRIEELVVYDSTPSVENIYNLGKLHIMAFSWFRYQGFIDEAVKYLLLSLADLAPRMHTSLKDGVPIETEEESTFAQAALKQLRDAGTIAHYARHSRRQGILPSESRFGHGSDWLQHTSRLHDLGRAITMQFEFSPLRDNRQMGIALTVLRLAEQLAPRNSFQRWEYLFSLGISHRVRHEVMQQETDIAEAIEMQSKAVEKLIFPNPRRIPALSCLAHSLMQSARASGDVAQYHQAVDHLERVVDAFYGFIHDRLEGAILWASLLHTNTPFAFEEEHAQLQKALEGYQKGILLLARAVWIGLSTSSRLARLHSVPKTFASDAAACAIRLAELQTDPGQRQEYLGKAVELLDEARAILWSQASQLHADLRLLSTQHSDLAAELNAVAHELARTAFKDGNADSGRTTEGLAYKWESLVERVRELDGFHDFLRSIPFAELRQAAGSTSIIIVNVSEHRCDALIIPPEGLVRLVPLPRLSKSQVEDDVQDIHAMLPSYEDRGEFESVLNDLWLDVCKPILAELRDMGVVLVTKVEGSQACLTG